MAEKYNPLDLGKLKLDIEGLNEFMFWGVGSLKTFIGLLHEIESGHINVEKEETAEWAYILSYYAVDRIDQVESFVQRLLDKFSQDEQLKTMEQQDGKKISTRHPGKKASVPAMEKSA